jgi:hypothetical protein
LHKGIPKYTCADRERKPFSDAFRLRQPSRDHELILVDHVAAEVAENLVEMTRAAPARRSPGWAAIANAAAPLAAPAPTSSSHPALI